MCGAENCSDFADFAVDRADLFCEFLRLENGVPSHDTFSRIFRLLDPAAFATCFGRFVTDLGTAGEGVLAIDGKTLRRSFDDAALANPLAVVTAFASAIRLVVAPRRFRRDCLHLDPLQALEAAHALGRRRLTSTNMLSENAGGIGAGPRTARVVTDLQELSS